MQSPWMVEQVPAGRKEIEPQYPDAASFYQHVEQVQKTCRRRLVQRSPKKASRAETS